MTETKFTHNNRKNKRSTKPSLRDTREGCKTRAPDTDTMFLALVNSSVFYEA